MENARKLPRSQKACIMDAQAMSRAVTRISHEIIEKNKGAQGITLVGVRRRGYYLAERIGQCIKGIEGVRPDVLGIDIRFYRDDAQRTGEPVVSNDDMSVLQNGAKIVLIDDVICTGRTVRAAIEAIFSHVRPQCVQLAVLVDRGLRELPFRPDFVGKNIPTSHAERVHVSVSELDGEDLVVITE